MESLRGDGKWARPCQLRSRFVIGMEEAFRGLTS